MEEIKFKISSPDMSLNFSSLYLDGDCFFWGIGTEKISPFEQYKVATSAVAGNEVTLPTDVYRLGTVFYAVGGTYDVEVERVEKNDFLYMEVML